MGIFDFLVRKQRHIEALVSEYLDLWAECLREFRRAMDVYLEKEAGDELAYAVEHTHRRESQADDLRRAIEYQMYLKALLPESRGDIMRFLESMDGVINRAETALFILHNEGVELPTSLSEEFRHLLFKTMESTDTLLTLAKKAFVHNPDLHTLVRAIDELESECDYVERNLIRKAFRTLDIEPLQRVLLRDLVVKVGDISDQAQKVANGVQIMSVKRRA